MVGLGTLLFLLAALVLAVAGCSGATCPGAGWFLRIASVAGVAAVITMEAGWVVSEVGRQPWIVYNLHEGRGRRHRQHRRVDHVRASWRAVRRRSAITTVLILRKMSRRFREPVSVDDDDVPYGPARPDAAPTRDEAVGAMSTAVAVVLFVAVTAYAVFGGADFGAGFWDLVAGGADAGRASPAR